MTVIPKRKEELGLFTALGPVLFDPELNQFDVLAMQLLMVLRDVRFYIPGVCHCSSSPIIGQLSIHDTGHNPADFRIRAGNLLRLQPGEQLNQLMSRFHRMVTQESGDINPADFVLRLLDDDIALENGNFHAGLKFNPPSPIMCQAYRSADWRR